MSNDCKATHRYASSGTCLAFPENHKGDHWAFSMAPGGDKFYWPNEAETLNPNIHLTSVEIDTLLTALQPIKQFFPELEQKLNKVKMEATREDARRN